MQRKEKLQYFRQSIRKNQLEEFFRKKRNIFRKPALQSGPLPKLQQPTLEILIQISTYSHSEQHIEQLYNEGWMPVLWMFIGATYFNTQEQYYASQALSNMTIISQSQLPSEDITINLINILKSNNLANIDNVLIIFFNLMYDHQEWRDYLIQQYAVDEILFALFQHEYVSEKFIIHLLKTIFKTIQRAERNKRFLKFIEPIINIVCSSVSLNQQLTFACLSTLNELAKMFEEETTTKVIEGRLLAKIGPLVKFFTDNKLTEMFLKFTTNICSHLSSNDFKTYLWPVIKQLLKKKDHRRAETCCLLYTGLEERKFSPFEFWLDSIHNELLKEFLNQDNEDLLIEYIHLFSLCLLNLNLQINEINQIQQGLKRASHLLDENIQMQGFIEESLQMFKGTQSQL